MNNKIKRRSNHTGAYLGNRAYNYAVDAAEARGHGNRTQGAAIGAVIGAVAGSFGGVLGAGLGGAVGATLGAGLGAFMDE